MNCGFRNADFEFKEMKDMNYNRNDAMNLVSFDVLNLAIEL